VQTAAMGQIPRSTERILVLRKGTFVIKALNAQNCYSSIMWGNYWKNKSRDLFRSDTDSESCYSD